MKHKPLQRAGSLTVDTLDSMVPAPTIDINSANTPNATSDEPITPSPKWSTEGTEIKEDDDDENDD